MARAPRCRRRCRRRAAAAFPVAAQLRLLLSAAAAAAVAVSGCSPESGFREAPALPVAAAPAEDRAAAEKTATALLDALKKSDVAALSAVLAAPPPASQPLNAWLKAKRLEPLAQATDWKVDEVRPLGTKGDRLLVRAGFQANGDPHRTNLTLTRSAAGAPWRISEILPPVRPTAPVGSAPQSGADAPKVGG